MPTHRLSSGYSGYLPGGAAADEDQQQQPARSDTFYGRLGSTSKEKSHEMTPTRRGEVLQQKYACMQYILLCLLTHIPEPLNELLCAAWVLRLQSPSRSFLLFGKFVSDFPSMKTRTQEGLTLVRLREYGLELRGWGLAK